MKIFVYIWAILSFIACLCFVMLRVIGLSGPHDYCADEGGVWDNEYQECRFDCKKWTKEAGCDMLSDEELEEYVNGYCKEEGKGLYRCRKGAFELEKRRQWQEMKGILPIEKDNKTLMIEAAEEGDYKTVQKYLDEYGVDINAQDEYGNTALHLAVSKNNPVMVRILLNRGADPNIENSQDVTSIMVARSVYIAEMLVNAGADFNKRVHYSSEGLLSYYYPEVVEFLLTKGMDPNIKDSAGNTMLHIDAMVPSKFPVLKLLVEHGGDLNALNNFGETPYDLAIDMTDSHPVNEDEILTFFREHKAKRGINENHVQK